MNRFIGVEAAHALTPEQVAYRLGTDPERGLSQQDARGRLASVGPNALERARRPAYIAIAIRQLGDPLVALLVVASVVSFAIGERVEAIAIGAIVVLNALLGFLQEAGAERAMFALRRTLEPLANVVREGREREVAIEQVVPGDLIVLRAGERVPADGRLVSAEGLAADESALTGESVPDDKSVGGVSAETPLADRSSMVFAGTSLTRGEGYALVTSTGARTEIGEVAHLAETAKPPTTPLQRRLRGLTRLMVASGVLLTVSLTGIRLLQGSSVESAFLLGVSVAVAAIPEGLAATVTIALALGARRMATRGAIVRRLQAVETLGGATVVASDKTGTLTENRLRVKVVAPSQEHDEGDVLRASVLASTARLVGEEDESRVAGDPIEGALLLAARERGISAEALRSARSLLYAIPFDSERKRMTVVYREDGNVRALVKGAPEVVLERCVLTPPERSRLESLTERWAAGGLRVLAIAERELDSGERLADVEVERDLTPVGLVALQDPLRSTAGEAVEAARDAGLRVEILTGDHPATARAIARELHLPERSVSARVTPKDKLRLVERLQAEREVVAVTGDGVNDAPALRRADVGVAMGESGTEAAREASDVVLTDDDFSTIVAAIREGRVIAENIRRFVAFLLSANLGEVLLFVVAVLAGLGVPMTVVQVLLVNVLTDGLPAVALARDPAPSDVMRRPPERGNRLFGGASWVALGLVGALVGIVALCAFLIGRTPDAGEGQTMAFATIALSELAVVFAVRSPLEPAWKSRANPYLFGGVAISLALLALALYVPGLHKPFGTVALDASQLAVVASLSLVPLVLIEFAKALLRRFAPDWARAALLPSAG